VTVNAAASGQALAQATSPLPGAGAQVTFHIYVPTTVGIVSLQPFVQEGAPSWLWTGSWVAAASLVVGWNTIVVAVPAASAPLCHLGVEFTTNGTGSTQQFFIDSVVW
jgi:hypothetical protein